jgi:triacylglycerol esterase/lipase EstA (alpha/beta hydrolase family)
VDARCRGDGAPVVLLPGFCAPTRSLAALERRIERVLGRPAVRFPLATGPLLPIVDVRRSAAQADALLAELARERAFAYVDVVAHSLGGLVAAYWLKRIDRGRRIRRVVTLGTPHAGTPIARAGALLLGLFSRALWQMIPGSSLLRELEAEPMPIGSELVAIASRGDAVVPAHCARAASAPRQRSVELARVGHCDLLWSNAAFRLVASALAAPLPEWIH